MADPRTFTLIGEFKDGITPELQKINNQLAALKNNFAGIGSRKNTGFRGATQEIGKLVSAHKNLSNSIKAVETDLRSTVGVLKQYRSEMGRAAAATRSFQKSGGNLGSAAFAKNMRQANTEAQRYLKTLQQINAQSPRAMRMPSGKGGGGARPSKGGGGGGMGPGGFHMAEFGFAYTLGNAISQPIQNAIVQGFQIGIGFMTKPFEYFANRFGERVQDELSDLKAAGGFFSIAQRQEGEKFIKTFDQAVDFTQANNKILAKLAASLPGSTQDYIEVSKRISDSVARTVMTDKGAAVKYAEELRRKDTSTYGLQAIEGTGAAAQQRAIQVMLGEMTKKTVLAGQGGRAGAGGMMGAYGLPQLTERMLSQDEVSMGQFQRYSAIFSDPMIMDALAREIPNINKTAKNSVDRFKALQKLYDTVLPPELVARYRRTFAGIQETFNTAIFGPETGLFGLGRKMQGLGKKMNEFGEYVDKTGKVVSDASMAMNADLSIYDLFRDIIVNTGQVLTPLVENFTLLWDPLQKIGLDLKRAREVTAEVLRSFHGYIKGWEDFEKNLSKDAKLLFQQGGGAPLRATLSTLSNLLAEVGAISDIDFAKYRDMMKDPSAKLGPILQEMVDKLLDSDIAKSIGEMIGTIVGTVLVEVSKVTGLISGRIEKSNKLVTGLQKGFKDAGGEQAFANIFKDVFTAMLNVLKMVWNLTPLWGKFLAVAMLIVPSAIQGLGMLIAEKMVAGVRRLRDACLGGLNKTFADAASCGNINGGGAGGRKGRRGGSMFVSRRQAAYARLQRMRGRGSQTPYAGPIGPVPQGTFYKGKRTAYMRPGLSVEGQKQGLARITQGFTKAMSKSAIGKSMTKVARFIPGGVVAAGAIDMGLRMASGEGIAKAAGGALFSGAGALAGGKAGAAIGTFFGPGLGTVIGGAIGTVAGGLLGDKLFSSLSSVFQGQGSAAKMQLDAAAQQLEASRVRLAGMGIQDVGGAAMMGVTDPMKLAQVVKMLGLGEDKKVVAYQEAAAKVRALSDSAQLAKDALFRQVEVYKNLKYTPEQIWNLPSIKNLSKTYTDLQTKTKTASTQLDTAFKNLPQKVSTSIAIAMQKMDTKTIAYAIANKINMMDFSGMIIKPTGQQQGPGLWDFGTPKPEKPDPFSAFKKPFGTYRGHLGDAVASEMKHKPPGSDLIVANTSETVIPAAGGYGMKAFIDSIAKGFAGVKRAFNVVGESVQQTDQNSAKRSEQTNTKITDYHTQTQAQILKLNQNLSSLSQQVATMGGMGGMGGGLFGAGMGGAGVGKVVAVGKMLQGMGLHVAENPAFGTGRVGKHAPGSYHYSGRAIDVTGSDAQLDAAYAKLKAMGGYAELLWRTAGHYDHLHVAYALGAGAPAFFGSQNAAVNWERSMVPGSVKVASVTSNSGENLGGNTYGDIVVTVNAGSTSDPDALATIVAMKIGEAVADARASSLFV